MFEGFTERTINFMWELRFNNNKPWFLEHKDEFVRDFQTPMRELGRDVFAQLKDTCGDRGFIHKLSRVYKDARRPMGDGPYRDHLWFSVERPSEEWTSTPVFWFELAPEEWRYGLGYYSARPLTMAKLRRRIDNDPKAFEKLIAPLSRQDEFALEGPEYVRKKEAPSKKTEPWYNKKSLALVHYQKNGNELFSPELTGRLVSGYKLLMPLYDYLITLDSDPDPRTPV